MRSKLVVVALFLIAPLAVSTAQTQPCLVDADTADGLVLRIREIINNVSEQGGSIDSFNLATVPDTAVRIVSDTLVCNQAKLAYTTATPQGDSASAATAVYVVQVGNTRYVVWDPHQLLGEYMWLRVFDQNWIYKGNLGG